jgi:hypothetical protein
MSALSVLTDALAELDKVQTGKVARAALLELTRQVPAERLLEIAGDLTDEAIAAWNPPGPGITDGAARKLARHNARQTVQKLLSDILEELIA